MRQRATGIMSQYELLRQRASFDDSSFNDSYAEQGIDLRPRGRSWLSISAILRNNSRKGRRKGLRPLLYLVCVILVLLFGQVTFNASYTRPSPFEIPTNENVYIAANIINPDLIKGHWGKSLAELVDLIGKDRVFVSIYGGPPAALALLDSTLSCNRSLVAQDADPIDLKEITNVTLPSGEEKVRRIAYLAEVRNRALAPLAKSTTKFDKILFINDVYFSPKDAARLLFGTNVKDGKADYKAACGADFVTSWKYYDTFATRDAEGYSMGLPIYPWFSGEGDAVSRRDVLAGSDAVRVKSCWGGIVAFDAKYFRQGSANAPVEEATSTDLQVAPQPLRFRAESEPFWEASECCLIHADILSQPDTRTPIDEHDTGIYMNPFVRVAYHSSSFRSLGFVKRFERLFALPQSIINSYAYLPRFNSRRAEVAGELVKDIVWVANETEATINKIHGHFESRERMARIGGYCGTRQMQVLKGGKLGVAERNWEAILAPS
jgi:hypothetical protein